MERSVKYVLEIIESHYREYHFSRDLRDIENIIKTETPESYEVCEKSDGHKWVVIRSVRGGKTVYESENDNTKGETDL